MKYFLVKLGQAFNFARKWTPSKLFSNKSYYYIQKTFWHDTSRRALPEEEQRFRESWLILCTLLINIFFVWRNNLSF